MKRGETTSKNKIVNRSNCVPICTEQKKKSS